MAALPALRSEWAILPPSSLAAARVWNVLTFEGKVGEVRDEPYSTAILTRQYRIPKRLQGCKRTGLDRDHRAALPCP